MTIPVKPTPNGVQPTARGTLATLDSCPVVELRQYTLHPGRLDTLARLFDSAFCDGQVREGIRLGGLYVDDDRPDCLVWWRGFADMSSRQESLTRFYGGPDWRRHRDEANATMVDSDNVFLLQPMTDVSMDAAAAGDAIVLFVATYNNSAGCRWLVVDTLVQHIAPAVGDDGRMWRTSNQPNNFPQLPIRTDTAVVWAADVSHSDIVAARPPLRELLNPKISHDLDERGVQVSFTWLRRA